MAKILEFSILYMDTDFLPHPISGILYYDIFPMALKTKQKKSLKTIWNGF